MATATAEISPAADLQEQAGNEFTWEFHERQTAALDALEEPGVLEVLYGGAKGGGKSVLGCRWVYLYADWIREFFNIKPSGYPVPVGFMGRKQSVDFNNTTLETWKRFIPPNLYTINKQDKEIIIKGAVKIDFGGLDRTETIQKFNSAEYAFFFLDQAEECSQDDIAVLRGTRRLKIGDRAIPPKGLLTANPRNNWLKPEFIQSNDPQKRFIPALPADNPYLAESYIDILKDAFKHRPALLEAYLYGSWDAQEDDDVIIRDVWIRNCQTLHFHTDSTRCLIAYDAARFGDDETVIYYMENTRIERARIYGQKDLMYTANYIHDLATEASSAHDGIRPDIVGDVNGMPGVFDRLKELEKPFDNRLIPFDSAATGSTVDVKKNRGVIDLHDPLRFGNLRAAAWWRAGEMFAAGEVEFTSTDDELIRQLNAVHFYFRSGKLYAESKDDLKRPERLGRSTDRADAFIYGLYALPMVRPVEEKQKKKAADPYREKIMLKRRRGKRSPMAV